VSSVLGPYRQAVGAAVLTRRIGRVRELGGLSVEVEQLDATVGELCTIWPRESAEPGAAERSPILAEVVGARAGSLALMPYGSVQGLAAGCLDLLRGGVDRAGELGMRIGGLRRDRDVGAVFCRAQGNRQTDATARAGDEQGASSKSAHGRAA